MQIQQMQSRQLGGIPIERLQGVVLQKNPLGDAVLALMVLLYHLGKWREDGDLGLKLILWAGGPEGHTPSREREQEWQRSGYYPVGVGSRHYHEARPGQPRAGSRTELVLRDLGLIQAAGLEGTFRASHEWLDERLPISRRLAEAGQIRVRRGEGGVETVDAFAEVRERCHLSAVLPFAFLAMAANQNNATGFLKQWGNRSAFWVVRELAKDGMDTRDIVRVIGSIFMAFFHAAAEQPRRAVEDMVREPALRPYLEPGAKQLFDPSKGPQEVGVLTIGQMVSVMWKGGVKVESIVAWAEWWLDRIEQIRAAEDATQLEFRSGACCPLRFAGGQAVKLTSDNPRLGRWAVRHAPSEIKLILIYRRTGNVAILSRGRDVNLAAVGEEFRRREPDRWYYDHRINAVLNGGHSFGDTPSTEIPFDELVRLIEKLTFFREEDEVHREPRGNRRELERGPTAMSQALAKAGLGRDEGNGRR